ncbi:MAG: hypothetical protein JW901_05475 [Dehalococcoidia bacterium]|nr:hypothetical protein [Dehalococcoidia bacterium]
MIGTRLYSSSLPAGYTLPAICYSTRGGDSDEYIPEIIQPSKQFRCYDDDPIGARAVYRALYDALQGIQNVKVAISGTDYYILSAKEEVQGQDLIDPDVPNLYYVLTFFSILLR